MTASVGCALQRDLGGHAGRHRAVLVGDGDLDAEGAGRGRGVAADVAHRAFDGLAVDQPDIGLVAELEIAQVALADLAARNHRIELEEGGHFAALHDGAAALHRHPVDDAVERRLDLIAVELGLRCLQLRLRRVRCERALSGCSLGRLPVLPISCGEQPAPPGAARRSCLALLDRRYLVLRVQHQHQIAGLDVLALLDRQVVDDAHDARGQHRALVGLGLPGNADGARIGLRGGVTTATVRSGALAVGLGGLGLGCVRRLGLIGFAWPWACFGGGAADGRERARSHPGGESDKHDNGCKLVKPDFRHHRFSTAGFGQAASSETVQLGRVADMGARRAMFNLP